MVNRDIVDTLEDLLLLEMASIARDQGIVSQDESDAVSILLLGDRNG